MKKILLNTVLLLGGFIVSNVQASLVLERYESGVTPTSIGGYALTDFSFNSVVSDSLVSVSSVDSPLTGTLSFKNRNGAAINLTENSADNIDWWVNAENKDYYAYTTNINWIEIILPENTLAFTFSVGADYRRASGWLDASDSSGLNLGQEDFLVNNRFSPSFGIYSDNSNVTAANCSYLSSVIIDPDHWGVGNFSIAQGDCAIPGTVTTPNSSNAVPEPSIFALMSFGLMGLVVARRKVK